MPPPPILQALRLCHPTWRTFQVRSASSGSGPNPPRVRSALRLRQGDTILRSQESTIHRIASSKPLYAGPFRRLASSNEASKGGSFFRSRAVNATSVKPFTQTPTSEGPARASKASEPEFRNNDTLQDDTKNNPRTRRALATIRIRRLQAEIRRLQAKEMKEGNTAAETDIGGRSNSSEEVNGQGKRSQGRRNGRHVSPPIKSSIEVAPEGPNLKELLYPYEVDTEDAKEGNNPAFVKDKTISSGDYVQKDRSSDTKHSATIVSNQGRPPTSETSVQNSVLKAIRNENSQSLLEELFPEAKKEVAITNTLKRSVPRLNIPNDALRETPTVQREYQIKKSPRESVRQRLSEALHSRGEEVTVLTLGQCSTELSESDFRRLIPKGKHIETWIRDGEFHSIIPGRDPISLERQPFYYLLFKSSSAALAYQHNVARLHKLARLHTPGDHVLSAIPPPPGLLEHGEDLHAVVNGYTLVPPTLNLYFTMVLQPYKDTLRNLIAQGGYQPIVSHTGERGHKVLLHVEGYEPGPAVMYQAIHNDGLHQGLQWGLKGGRRGLSRLADLHDLDKLYKPPKSTARTKDVGAPVSEDQQKQESKRRGQEIMHKLYNRWIVEFDEESVARRFARVWHRRPLPSKEGWKETEQARICNAEYLW